jgi:hypothetical protein
MPSGGRLAESADANPDACLASGTPDGAALALTCSFSQLPATRSVAEQASEWLSSAWRRDYMCRDLTGSQSSEFHRTTPPCANSVEVPHFWNASSVKKPSECRPRPLSPPSSSTGRQRRTLELLRCRRVFRRVVSVLWLFHSEHFGWRTLARHMRVSPEYAFAFDQ